MADDCKNKCMLVGMMFDNQIYTLRDEKYAPAVFPLNVAGKVRESSLNVPHSELAMHVGAAGKKLMAWAIREDSRYAHIVYEDGDGCCEHTHGLPEEVLSPELIRTTKELCHIKESEDARRKSA